MSQTPQPKSIAITGTNSGFSALTTKSLAVLSCSAIARMRGLLRPSKFRATPRRSGADENYLSQGTDAQDFEIRLMSIERHRT